MTGRLRLRHRRLIGVLSLALPPALALALLERPEPAPTPLPTLLVASPAVGPERWTRDDLWAPLAIRSRLFEPVAEAGPVVELMPRDDLRRPSVLVYWAGAGAPEALPPGAHLVGRLAGGEARRFALPPAARSVAGRLYLYSLGHHELLGSAALPGGSE